MNTIYPTPLKTEALHQAMKMKRQKSFLGKVRNTSQRLKTAAQELWQDLISIIWWFPLQKGGPQKISKDCDFFLGLYTQIYLFNFLFFFFYSQLNNMIKVSHLWTCRGKPKQLIAKTSLFCFATPPNKFINLIWFIYSTVYPSNLERKGFRSTVQQGQSTLR